MQKRYKCFSLFIILIFTMFIFISNIKVIAVNFLGYILNKSIVVFEVKGDEDVTKVSIENSLWVDVPDTLDSRSALLCLI